MPGTINKKTAHLWAVLLVNIAGEHKSSYASIKSCYTFIKNLSNQQKSAQVAWITLSGPIVSSSALAEKLIAAQKDHAIAAILLHIESPGGTVGASEILHRLVKEIASEKPIIVLVENYCTSGAYWTACGATTIITPSAADLGSIGVLSQIERHKEIIIKNQQYEGKADIELFQAGKYKTLTHKYGTTLSESDREELKDHIFKIYDVFTQTVAQARNLDLSKKDIWAEGRVFIGKDAVNLGLADQEGGLIEAIEELKRQIRRYKHITIENIEFVKY